MLPKNKLPPHVIADFETWVRLGAPDPRSTDTFAAAKAKESIDWGKARGGRFPRTRLRGGSSKHWDQHGDMAEPAVHAKNSDQPIAGLLTNGSPSVTAAATTG